MTVQDFVNEWSGKPVPSRAGITGQCVSLVQRWAEENGIGGTPVFPVANARDIPHSRDDAFTWIPNVVGDLTSFPQPGDIVVFNWNHTGLCVSADGNTINLFEENDPISSGAHLNTYSFNGCVGWYRIKNFVPVSDVDAPAADNEGVVNGSNLRGHLAPNTSSASPWYFDNNEHITLLAKTQGENVASGPYAPSAWWYLAHGNDSNAQASGYPQVWVSDAFVRTTHDPANVPDYVSPTTTPPAPPAPTGRLLYDSTSASDIPADAPVVAGYVDGKYAWSDADWARFSGDKVRIAVFASTNDGQVLDVENGDATPQEAPGWVKLRRAAGLAEPTCYVNRSNWQAVRDAFTAASEQEPTYWVSTLDGAKLNLGGGVVACQYAGEALSGGHYDLSTVADGWPGEPAPIPTPIPAPEPTPDPPVPTPAPVEPTPPTPQPPKIIPVVPIAAPLAKPSILVRFWEWLVAWLTKEL